MNGHPKVIEYAELPEKMAEEKGRKWGIKIWRISHNVQFVHDRSH